MPSFRRELRRRWPRFVLDLPAEFGWHGISLYTQVTVLRQRAAAFLGSGNELDLPNTL
jgi:hypothetical protein